MSNEDHRRRVLHSLESALSKDRVKTGINGFSALGLVEMTRKRTRESIEHVLCQDCPVCKGRGTLKTVETVCYEIMREIVRVHHAYDSDRFLVYVSPTVGEALKPTSLMHWLKSKSLSASRLKFMSKRSTLRSSSTW